MLDEMDGCSPWVTLGSRPAFSLNIAAPPMVSHAAVSVVGTVVSIAVW
jgi:hypothetical protein